LVNKRSYEWDWHKYVTTLEVAHDSESSKRGGVNQPRKDVEKETTPRSLMTVREHSSSVPFVVHGGSAEAKEIWFMPRPKYTDDNGDDCGENARCINANYLSIHEFSKLYETYFDDSSGNRAKIPLQITAMTLSEELLDVECQLFISEDGMKELVQDGFSVLPCKRENPNSRWLWFL